MNEIDQDLWDKAYATILRLRGSDDAVAFEFCVLCEYKRLLKEKEAKDDQ